MNLTITSNLLDGKVAIVTGAGQGCGKGTALALAGEGAAVALAGRTFDKVVEAAEQITAAGGRAFPIRCDVSIRTDVEAMVAATVERFGPIDILVNNAGTTPASPRDLADLDDASVLDELRTGALGSLYGMQACFPHMKDRGGRIVNLGSAWGIRGEPGYLPYAMTKEAIRSLTKVAAQEWGCYGITVNTVCPAARTEATEQIRRTDPVTYEQYVGRIPLQRFGDVELDIGRAITMLVSPGFSYVTAATLMLDGGMCVLAA